MPKKGIGKGRGKERNKENIPSESDSEDDGHVSFAESDEGFPILLANQCTVCRKENDGKHPRQWIGCNCGRWLHKACTNVEVNFEEMTQEELEKYPFECDFC